MSNSNPPEPARIARLPRSRRGLPIIAAIDRDDDGHADFASVSDERRVVLAILDLCGICGLPLNRDRISVVHRDSLLEPVASTSEPPLHEMCAAYAVQVCPYLVAPTAVIRRGTGAGTPSSDLLLARHAPSGDVFAGVDGIQFSLPTPLEVFDFTEAEQRYSALLAADQVDPVPGSFAPVLHLLEAPGAIRGLRYEALYAACMSPILRLGPDEELVRLARRRALASGDMARHDPFEEARAALNGWFEGSQTTVPYIVADSRARMK